MQLSQPYAERVLYALSDAITSASTDTATRTVTYHRKDAVRACLAMAAVMAHGDAEGAPALTPAEAAALVAETFGRSLGELNAALPRHVLDAGRPGFTTHTLA